MSLWADGEQKDGKQSFYFIAPDPIAFFFCVLTIPPLLLPLLAPMIRWLHSLF